MIPVVSFAARVPPRPLTRPPAVAYPEPMSQVVPLAENAAPDAPNRIAVEAARYALLRRLAPSMRHHLVVNLQPIGMVHEVMERRLRAPSPDLAQVQAGAAKINGFARAALQSCLDVVSWLAPDDGAVCRVEQVAEECAGLLNTHLSFRGFALRNRVDPVAGEVSRSAVRNGLAALLLHATDTAQAPAEVVLEAEALPHSARVTVRVQPMAGEPGIPTEPPYRRIDWEDVEALVQAESARLERPDDRTFRLELPWVVATVA